MCPAKAAGTPPSLRLLTEQGTSTDNDRDRVLAKEPGDVLRHTPGHIARGSRGVPFMRRQSRAGAETWPCGTAARAEENCSSGGMRWDHALLSRLQLQSTSDQQNLQLYAPIAASAPTAVTPEQGAVWS
ncbi:MULTISPECIES: hypothetical protein [unclassified Streptomyces]|uniref:hypothetical protein n=1 Tax=unclassified Streptomyces TaxID=2593676 RepID=UPI002E276AF3